MLSGLKNQVLQRLHFSELGGFLFSIQSCSEKSPLHNNNQQVMQATAFLLQRLSYIADWLRLILQALGRVLSD
jgi:hypothetical protein